jgi:hypothetical protein
MAKITTSTIVADIKQQFGNTVFQGTPGGIMVRTQKAKTQTKPTAAQTYIANYRILLNYWQHTLDLTARNNWLAQALLHPIKDVFKNDVKLSGWSFFVKINMPLLSAGHAIQPAPPTDYSCTYPLNFTASANHTTPSIQIDSLTPTLAATEQIVIGCNPFIKPSWGRIPARLPTIATSGLNPSFPFDFTVPYLHRFGLLQLGMCIGLTLHILNSINGIYSVSLYTTLTVT